MALPIWVPFIAAIVFCLDIYWTYEEVSPAALQSSAGQVTFVQKGTTGPKWDTRYIGIFIDSGNGPMPYSAPMKLTDQQRKAIDRKTVVFIWAPTYDPFFGSNNSRIYRLTVDGQVMWSEADALEEERWGRALGLTWLRNVVIAGLLLLMANAAYLTISKRTPK